MEFYSVLRKEENHKFSGKLMLLKRVMFGTTSQTQKKNHVDSHM